ncbi:MAG TPA: radical SAM protein [Candidatus Omnitrophota bacterium]|nr:radical SAM protein [Candidatus Omnitrophota bacterium]HQQ06394.1 radical SAM protein [Candidatus Omnitrophota bacterium]
MQPAYLKAYENGTLDSAVKAAGLLLQSCTICPRRCKVDRTKGETGFCKTAARAEVYSYLAHHGEEPPISGTKGSGTIFFSHCNMACLYCQNYEFSQKNGQGGGVSSAELARIMLDLQKRGCHNINLVSPTHVMPQILEALKHAVKKGLTIPLVYNTGGYELPKMIHLLDGIVDVYLVDMRYADKDLAIKFSAAAGYPEYNQAAVREMHCQAGLAQFDEKGIIEKGLIIRHLVLPENIAGTEQIMKFIAEEISIHTYISLMSQYTPYYKADEYHGLNRRITVQEYKTAQDCMDKYGLHNGWTQDSGGLERFAGVNIKPVI